MALHPGDAGIYQDKAKWQVARELVDAVNVNGSFGTWEFKALDKPKELFEVVR